MSATLYSIRPGDAPDTLQVEKTWEQTGSGPFPAGLSYLVAVPGDPRSLVLGIDGASGAASVFEVHGGGTTVSPVSSSLNLGGPWDVVESFLIGNQPHLLTYAAAGQFAFHPITSDLRSLQPYRYRRNHAPGVTAGFTVAAPIVVGNAVYWLAYGFDSGRVLIYSLAVTAQSSSGDPPLVSDVVWEHQWAAKWTRFAFFRLGGGAYFLKTNVGRLNVNIDRVRDNPADGTVEVGTQLDLDRALDQDMVRSFHLAGGQPHFLTYIKDGTTTYNRIHADCLGWTTEYRQAGPAQATQIVPLQVDGDCYVLFY